MAVVDPDRSEELADALIGEFGSLDRLWSQSPEALARVLGPGSALTKLLLFTRKATLEAMRGHLVNRSIDPFDPRLRQYLIASMGSLPDEHLRILFLDGARRLIADEELQRGTLAQLALYPRTIFRRALEHNAATLILVHNHPSGDPLPSEKDVEATRKLDLVGRALDIQILDHIVVTASHAHHIVSEREIAGTTIGSTHYTLRSQHDDAGKESNEDAALANAQAAVRRRLLRRQLVGADELFGEPAWEMLLDLFIHEREGKPLSISSLCMVAGIPMSSALRLVQRMSNAGLMCRMPDPHDGRRSFMRLDPSLAHRLSAYFEAGQE